LLKATSQSKTRRGFGLLEVVFSTAIFIVVVGSLVGLSRLSLRNAVLSTHRSQAINLAQDGLEIVRQMRDTAWIQGPKVAGQAPGKAWLTYPNCVGGYPATGVELTNADYAICYDTTNFTGSNPAQFGVKKMTAPSCSTTPVDTDLCLTLRTGSSPTADPDPGAPLSYMRTVRFEQVPSTNSPGTCDGGITPASDLFQGLQILTVDDNGKICTTANVESTHFVRVKVTVSWRDFDKDWDVSLSTLLTDWRAK
jgi:Tfp pilus assembly protein PilV